MLDGPLGKFLKTSEKEHADDAQILPSFPEQPQSQKTRPKKRSVKPKRSDASPKHQRKAKKIKLPELMQKPPTDWTNFAVSSHFYSDSEYVLPLHKIESIELFLNKSCMCWCCFLNAKDQECRVRIGGTMLEMHYREEYLSFIKTMVAQLPPH